MPFKEFILPLISTLKSETLPVKSLTKPLRFAAPPSSLIIILLLLKFALASPLMGILKSEACKLFIKILLLLKLKFELMRSTG